MAEIKTDIDTEQNEAFDQIRGVYEDKEAEINGRIYSFTKTTHQKRLTVFAYFTSIQNRMNIGDFSFFAEKEWRNIQQIIDNVVMFDGSLLSKLPDHWEQYAEDFIILYSGAMGVMSYPFLPGKKQG
jgi:hypothetical protein